MCGGGWWSVDPLSNLEKISRGFKDNDMTKFIATYPTPTDDDVCYMHKFIRACMVKDGRRYAVLSGAAASVYDARCTTEKFVDVLPHAGERTATDWMFWTQAERTT